MSTFEFHPDLFECRNIVLETLGDHGYAWLSHFGSVDILHDVFGVEVCGIQAEADAQEIEHILRELFPDWQYISLHYNSFSRRDPGWRVKVSRDPENYHDDWRQVDP